ncbi:M50 family metallopeptidase [Tsukamurella paurometabola]|uniref:M50 family metallopeptidase n=1 Tax=Tsukamurella paurometabola TaxID=2061 RepID=A0ABS5NHX2_TSUPA|nr:M50 family metallopeptidase [Tsukamurella paurometabola]MBS4103895.1 M50 family metallopeptidase [Tsukamurella paurometabola]
MKRPPDATREAAKQIKTARERASMAVHESAHAVAAVLLGGHVELAQLAPEDRPDHRGLTTVSEDSLSPDGRALVAHAGPWAEARFDAGRRPTQREVDRAYASSGHGDLAMITAAGGPAQLGVERVEKVIEANWDVVLKVARQLAKDGFATHWSVTNALGLPSGDPGGPTSFGLACVKAGMRPVRR